MKQLNFKKELEKIAQYNGFSAVGITSPNFADIKIKKRLELFLKNNWHAEMKWLEKRTDARAEGPARRGMARGTRMGSSELSSTSTG